MGNNSFSNKKELKFVLTLENGAFNASGSNIVTLQGYRAIANIALAGIAQCGTLTAAIYGVKQELMNQCSVYPYMTGGRNIVTVDVYAIDGATQTLVFTGNIQQSWGDYRSMPDAFLMIQANAAFQMQIQGAPPTSYNGPVDVSMAMATLAKNMNLTFENTSPGGPVTTKLNNVYLASTWLEQARSLADAAGIDFYIDGSVLAICPQNMPRVSLNPRISKSSGLVGYPSFDGIGVVFETVFNPSIKLGGEVTIDSEIPNANGTWIVGQYTHILESEKPGGSWFSNVRANWNGLIA